MDFSNQGITRRKLFIGGGVGVGLLVGWGLWPRAYRPIMATEKGEHLLGPWLKISETGQVIIAIPQSESGQGVFTALAQILAGELGADWRTVAIQPVMPSPNFANDLLAREWATAFVAPSIDPVNGGPVAQKILGESTKRENFVATGGSTSVRQFEIPCRQAGAAARAVLCMAAAKRWGVAWETCVSENGFVLHEGKKLRFGELVADAAELTPPDPLPLRPSPINALSGKEMPRLDAPAKVDGSMNFAGDIRLPDMLFASVRGGPLGDSKLKSFDKAAAFKIKGVRKVVHTPHWLAAVASNGWAANQALDAMAPIFETKGRLADSADMTELLENAIAKGSGRRAVSMGNVDATLDKAAGTRVYHADYSVGAAVHAPLETRSATAHFKDGRLQLWLATQAPQSAIDAAAKAIGISTDDVVLYPVVAGGSFDRNFDHQIAAQVAVIAKQLEKPVQLVWSRAEDFMRDHVRGPALGRMTATINIAGQIAGLSIRIAAPSTMRELAGRLSGDSIEAARTNAAGDYDPLAIEGALPPYAISNLTVDHFPVGLPIPTGPYRALSHGYTAFFVESFIDELAHKAGVEPLSYRMQMLVGQTRLARCLTGVAAMAGWDGGVSGSSKGIACHSMRGSHIALIATAKTGEKGVRVENIAAMVDCGRLINPDLARQQIEGAIVFGMAQALGGATEYQDGLPLVRRLREIDLPLLSDIPEITVEFIRSDEDPGGISEIGVPPVAPAIANALFAASGLRLRELPLLSGGA